MGWKIRRGQHGLRARRCRAFNPQNPSIPKSWGGFPSRYPSHRTGSAGWRFLENVIASYFCYTSLLIFNICCLFLFDNHGNHQLLLQVPVKTLIFDIAIIHTLQTGPKNVLDPDMRNIKKRIGFSSKLTIQGLQIHLPKSHFRHFIFTHRRTHRFQNC